MGKRLNKNHNSILLEAVRNKPIAFNPLLAKIADSATAGLFMSQLLYWWDKGVNPDWVYKTVKEFEDETTLTRSEQEIAIKKWRQLGALTTKLAQVPAKRHFHINWDKLVSLMADYIKDPSLLKTANKLVENNHTARYFRKTITEMYPKITQENNLNSKNNLEILKEQKQKLLKNMSI